MIIHTLIIQAILSLGLMPSLLELDEWKLCVEKVTRLHGRRVSSFTWRYTMNMMNTSRLRQRESKCFENFVTWAIKSTIIFTSKLKMDLRCSARPIRRKEIRITQVPHLRQPLISLKSLASASSSLRWAALIEQVVHRNQLSVPVSAKPDNQLNFKVCSWVTWCNLHRRQWF